MKKTLFSFLTLGLAMASAEAVTYKLTVTNGSAMPLSPSVIYSGRDLTTDRHIGAVSPEGFTRLCRDGDAAARDQELSGLPGVLHRQKTDQMILPGETKTLMVKVLSPSRESIHFETMYGKTRDVCGVFSIPSRDLSYLHYNSGRKLSGRDHVVRTGVYLPPLLPDDTTSLCTDGNAVTCLRSLSPASPERGTVHYFRPYLPDVLSFLEDRFGAAETDTLLIPTGGAITYTLQKH